MKFSVLFTDSGRGSSNGRILDRRGRSVTPSFRRLRNSYWRADTGVGLPDSEGLANCINEWSKRNEAVRAARRMTTRMSGNCLVAILENLIQGQEQKFADETGGKGTELRSLTVAQGEKRE